MHAVSSTARGRKVDVVLGAYSAREAATKVRLCWYPKYFPFS